MKSTSHWNTNYAICQKEHPHIVIDLELPDGNHHFIPSIAKSGLPTIMYRDNDLENIYLHCQYDPISEAKHWISSEQIYENSIIIVLGIGFSYHIIELIKTIPDTQTIILVEYEAHILREAFKSIDLKEVLKRKNLNIFIGKDASDAVKHISRVQLTNKHKKICFIKHRPSLHVFPYFYKKVINSFTNADKFNIYDRLRYKKFSDNEIKILLLNTSYFLSGEIMNTLDRLRIQYRPMTIHQDKFGRQEYIEELIKNILEFKPDFLLTVNHIGLDCEGVLTRFLESIEMPVASWYVDNPNLVIRFHKNNVSPFCTMFLWDKNTLHDMKAIGFENSFFLPLGVDEKRFKPIKNTYNSFSKLSPKVCFVGNSMSHKVKESLDKTNVNGDLRLYFNDIAKAFMESEERHIESTLKYSFPKLYHQLIALHSDQRNQYEAAVFWEATRNYRLSRVQKLLPFSPLIVGDSGWTSLLDCNLIHHHREISYYNELPGLYNATTINFNATSRQMKGAVNQRIFDVPACNSFLLTDYQEQMEDLFNIGEEMICYHAPEEIEDLVKYYLRHDNERIKIAEKGFKRVIRDHTYLSRINAMTSKMKVLYH